MADEYYNNKIVTTDGDVLMDVTQDTATPETVLEGETFHLRSGAPAVGTYRPSDEIEARLRATVGHTCKNLFDLTKHNPYASGITVTSLDVTTGTIVANASGAYKTIIWEDTALNLPADRKYIISLVNNSAATGSTISIYNKADRLSYTKINLATTGDKSFEFDPADYPSGYSFRLFLTLTSSSSATGAINISSFMIRDGSIADDTFESYVMPTDEAKQDKPVMLYDAGESSVGVHSVTGLSNLTQYSELHITLFAPVGGDTPDLGYTQTILYPFMLPNIPTSQAALFDCWITALIDGAEIQKRVGIGIQATNTTVEILGEIDEQDGGIDNIPSNHYIYIKRIVGIPK